MPDVGAGVNHGPLEVKTNHTHFDIGDEALLLSNIGTTIVSKNRSSGAKLIEGDDRNFDVIIMDDGLQNNQLHKDINILLIDKNRIFGNEYCIPAGPLREPLSYGIKKINTILRSSKKPLTKKILFVSLALNNSITPILFNAFNMLSCISLIT